jgi:hypothetical protein
MLAVRRTVLAAAMVCLSALSIAAPAAIAETPTTQAPAATRAADPVPVETPVYLVEQTTNRSVGVEVYANWDYLKLSAEGRLADHVTFHREGNGYTIQQGTTHWAGYNYWHISLNHEMYLGEKAGATIFHVQKTDKGLMLWGQNPSGIPAGQCAVIYGVVTRDRWLYCGTEVNSLQTAWAYFHIVKK